MFGRRRFDDDLDQGSQPLRFRFLRETLRVVGEAAGILLRIPEVICVIVWSFVVKWFFHFPLGIVQAAGIAVWEFLYRWFFQFMETPLGIVGSVLRFPLFIIEVIAVTIGVFIFRWLGSRPLAAFWRSLPFVLFSVAVGFLLLAAGGVSRSDLVVRYRRAAATAAASGDTDAAQLWLEKNILLNPNDPAHQFRLAIAAEQDGRYDQAREIMRTLAPDDTTGYGPAHLWTAGQIARRRATENSPPVDTDQLQERLRHHLTAGLEYDPDHVPALQELAQLELDAGNQFEAINLLERLVRKDRKFSFTLATLHVLQGNQASSRRVADAGIDYFRHQVENDPDDVESRIHWARLLGFMEQFELTVEILIQGINRKPEPDDMNMLRMDLGQAFLGWAKHVERTQPDEIAQRLKLLQQALKCSPDHPGVLEKLAALVCTDTEEAQAAYRVLSSALAKGTATPMVHLLLGIAAYQRGRHDLEERHLRLALNGDPQLVVAMNNLTWLFASGDPPRVDEALELVEHAVKLSPDYPELRATRGRIYQILGRTDDAILDLEFALSQLPDRPDIHAALADLYAAIGDDDLARLHREQAAKVKTTDKTTYPGRRRRS